MTRRREDDGGAPVGFATNANARRRTNQMDLTAACAAAKRAMSTRNGEHET